MKYGLFLAILLSGAAQAQTQTVACHITYGGETRVIEAAPVSTPYTVPTVEVGSYFLFRLVFEAGTAIKAYVYADRDSGPVPLHQASFDYPLQNAGRYGFSGQHFVYEPVRDGELQYWCELRP
jgi:hypothetical protein